MKVGVKRIKVDMPYDMWVGLQRMKGKSDEARLLTLAALFNRKHDEMEHKAQSAMTEAREEAAAAQKPLARAWRAVKGAMTPKCGAVYGPNEPPCNKARGHDGPHDNGDVIWAPEAKGAA